MQIDIHREVPISSGARVRQLESMFDVPRGDTSELNIHGEIELPSDFNVGLIVGPSGSGKSTVLSEVFAHYDMAPPIWKAQSVIEDFSTDLSMSKIAEVCQAVGFNTIPAWMRPYNVLSNGEQFRVEMARRLLEGSTNDIIVMDEFTSVVDRQVAKIVANAVQKYVRRNNLAFVAASCHYDIIDWLNPDWVLEMPALRLEKRELRQRPALDVAVGRASSLAWPTFAPFHYLTASLNKSAKQFVLWVKDDHGLWRPASFAATLHRPHAKVDDVEGVSRLVTLPDWQGLGLAFVLAETLGASFAALGKRLHTYPAHPALIRGFDKSPNWGLVRKPGEYSRRLGDTTSITGKFGGRACAVFRYVGEPATDPVEARRLIHGDK